ARGRSADYDACACEAGVTEERRSSSERQLVLARVPTLRPGHTVSALRHDAQRLHARARATGARRRRAARPAARALLLHRLLLRAGRAAGARRRRARVYRRRRRGACDSEPRALGAASELAAPGLPPRVDLLAGGEPDAFL